MTLDLCVLIGGWFASNSASSDTLGNLASLVTIVSLGLAPIVYFAQRWHHDRSERKQASDNLHKELKDTLEALNREMYQDDAMSFETEDENEYFFMNRRLNHDFYDSLIFSGKINFLRSELQQRVQNIFNQIKTHNEYLKLVEKMSDE